MFIIYDDASQFKIGKILSKAETSLQIETQSGKRSKIKMNQVILSFDKLSSDDLMDQAKSDAEQLSVPFLWECAPSEEFNITDFAAEYFGAEASTKDKLALLLALHDAPLYFHRKGKGIYRAAPPEILEAALNAQEKKRQQEALKQAWIDQLTTFEIPEEMQEVIHTFLVSPDKNTLAWKAFEKTLENTGLSIEGLLLKLGVYKDELSLFWGQFLQTHFPKGAQQKPQELEPLPELPISDVQAYSIDNSSTTEIDDALGVQHIQGNIYRISIHIAVPALLVTAGSEADLAARKHMSTVYVPGTKIPMQADNIIETFSLDQDQARPALSLYAEVDIESGEVLNTETKLEIITVKENLRLENLESLITHEALEDPESDMPYSELFRPLWQMMHHLKKAREVVRGKPELNNRTDFNFKLDGPADDMNSRVHIETRLRNAPLDMIVSEYMIFANSTWAGMLKELGLPGIFRSQNGGRVRQSTHPDIHENIGVMQYGWMTSPLRRYVDLINQQQLLSGLEHGVSARLVAPYPPKSVDLMTIMTKFDATYTQWRSFQDRMERYWTLRWLQQQEKTIVRATVIRENLVRLVEAPLVMPLNDLPPLEKGVEIELEILGIDLLNLKVDARYLTSLSDTETPAEAL